MDRNLWWGVRKAVGSLVALRKESVDRNIFVLWTVPNRLLSLSARRAWIEIKCCFVIVLADPVALRKESVDRNNISTNNHVGISKVALRKESVDRN